MKLTGTLEENKLNKTRMKDLRRPDKRLKKTTKLNKS